MTAKNSENTYFYIHDHLGSTSMVLDADGNISQSVTYVPYGEIFVEERNGAWNSPYLFNSKELDEETGLYYYGARYLNPTNGMWLSVDPLWEKYAGMSPYNYCADNPVKLVDVDGREVDINGLTDEQLKIFNENMNSLRESSPLFNKLYSALETSKNRYTIKVGKTSGIKDENEKVVSYVDGQYSPKTNAITFLSIDKTGTAAVVAEEFFHAYQLSENKEKYANGEFNYEFEAKVFTTAVCSEYLGYEDIKGMSEFQSRIMNEEFGNKETYLSHDKINTDEFFNKYKEAANSYAKYNIEKKYGNGNYHKKTEVKPYSLISITK